MSSSGSTRKRNKKAASSSSLETSSHPNKDSHPFENAEILSTIFSFCSVRDLKNCRLVGSKVWLNASMPIWREKAVLLVLPEEDRHGYYHPGIILRDLKKLHNSKKHLLQFHQKPFKNYKLQYGKHSKWNWIYEKLSAHIEYLALKTIQFRDLKAFLDTILLKVPNLVELKLEDDVMFDKPDNSDLLDLLPQLSGYPGMKPLPAYSSHEKLRSIIVELDENSPDPVLPYGFKWEKLLSNIPNLRRIEIKTENRRWGQEREANQVMKAVEKIRRSDKDKLKDLEIIPSELFEYAEQDLPF